MTDFLVSEVRAHFQTQGILRGKRVTNKKVRDKIPAPREIFRAVTIVTIDFVCSSVK